MSPEAPKPADLWITLVCAAVVVLYAAQRFNTPDTNRLSTTSRLFYWSGLGYVLASLGVYFLLAQVVLNPGVLTLFGFDKVTELIAKYAAAPVLAAAVLTTLLPQTPVLRNADAWLLAQFQRLGRIPYGVSQLADRLPLQRLVVGEQELKAAKAWIERQPNVPNELASRLSADPPNTPSGMFAALLVMHQSLEALLREASYRHHLRRNEEAWRRLKAEFEVFTAQSQAFFVLFDQLIPRAGEEASNAALKHARSTYLGIGERMRTATAEFLVRALVAVEKSDEAVADRIERLGFATEDPIGSHAEVGALVFLGVLMILGLLGVVSLYPPPGAVSGAMVAVTIGTTQTCALLVAILLKAKWRFFRRQGDSLPYFGWLLTALVAGVLALVIDRGVIALSARALEAASNFATFSLSPSAPLAAGLAFVISILCDTNLDLGRFTRLLEGVLAGIAMVACMALCVGLLPAPPRTGNIAPYFPFLLSFALGLVAGLFAPFLYRHRWGGPALTPQPGLQKAALA